MKFSTVKFCCFCIKLRTGALLLGWFGTFLGIMGLVPTTFSWSRMEMESFGLNETAVEMGVIGDPDIGNFRFLMIFAFLHFATQTLASIYLLIGIFQETSCHVKIWLFATFPALIFGILLQILTVHLTTEHDTLVIYGTLLLINLIALGE